MIMANKRFIVKLSSEERKCLDAMVTRVRSKLVNEGLDAVFARKKRETPPVQPIFDGERQAQLIALACSKPNPARPMS